MTRFALCLVFSVGCAHGEQPRKGHAARTMSCKRGKVELSKTFEDTWRGDDGVMRLRYSVTASCHQENQAKLDYWRDCKWGDDDWDCADWKSGDAPPSDRAQTDWIHKESRGR